MAGRLGRPTCKFGKRAGRGTRTRLASLALAFATLTTAEAVAQIYRAPRTATGQPDLEGIWTNASLTRLERSPAFAAVDVPEAQARAFEQGHSGQPPIRDDVGQADTEWWELGETLARIDGQARASWVVEPTDGLLPLTEAGIRGRASLPSGDDGPESRWPTERCLGAIGSPARPPMLNGPYNSNYQIIQTPEHVAIVVEMNHDVRIIRLADKRIPPASVRSWMGVSIGRWEGETLVVETTNMHPAEAARGGPAVGFLYTSQAATVVERFTRIGPQEIRYEFTALDPQTFSRPWRAEMVFLPSKGPLYEFACHEGNYSMSGILAGARRQEADARAAKPALR